MIIFLLIVIALLLAAIANIMHQFGQNHAFTERVKDRDNAEMVILLRGIHYMMKETVERRDK